LKDEVISKVLFKAPVGGHVVPAAHAAWVGEKLIHGIHFERIAQPKAAVRLETFRASKVTYSKATFEGHTTLTFEGSWHPESRAIPAGSLFVPTAQPNARVLVALLEPQAPDSLAANPQARLDFFYRRSSSSDERLNLYPVYRVAAQP
jgi:hypothetical protein